MTSTQMAGTEFAGTHFSSTDIEARLLSVVAPRSPATSDTAREPEARAPRFDGDVADPHAVLDYLRSWEGLTPLLDEHLATGDHASYLTAIGKARLASGVSVVVAKHAVELLVARRARLSRMVAGQAGRGIGPSCD